MDKDRLAAALALLNRFSEIGLTEPILQRTISLRHHHRRLKIPDAIVAATALELDLPVVTRNVADFVAIVGLQVMDPFS